MKNKLSINLIILLLISPILIIAGAKYIQTARDSTNLFLFTATLSLSFMLLLVILRSEDTKKRKDLLQERLTILNSIGDCVIAVDRSSQIILMNRAVEDILGYHFNDLVRQDFFSILKFSVDEKQIGRSALFESVLRSGKMKHIHPGTILTLEHGKRIPVAGKITPLKDSADEVRGCVITFRDLTAEQELDRDKVNFSTIAAHQLRTPLSAARWNIEMIRSYPDYLPDKVKAKINSLYESSLRMIQLVDDLLTVSRIHEQKLEQKPQLIDIVEGIKKTIGELEGQIKTRAITFSFVNNLSSPSIVFVDPSQFQQTLENILSNSIKYSQPKGTVILTVEKKENNIVLSVQDNGIGIPSDEQKHLFEKFFRASNASTSDTTGTGLGLYVAKSYVQKWGGDIWFHSVTGAGSVFYISIPIASIDTGKKEV